MRIEGYIDHPIMKITVFKMENKYSIKFETDLYEQTYKLKTGSHLEGFDDVKQWADEGMQEKVLEHFNNMHLLSMKRNAELLPEEGEEFEEII